ncbi:dTDP-4-dehydrorhamnose 3,5-epimerase [Bacillus toyonensis]|uniref:dTDP-4-dehydrorhamnose 3,5-epimerase n=1 Tax=Bacillus toyonensis TaxID=155322 RepID=UPI0018A14ABE|nr:dTDP-4-dehydrorhamnose 3,5-epimerase [Bacillus toyonensis]MBF7145255.1 dTDP-4-dehydrorhamnose 3,5-epimerase [Bacillus toyonensis]MEC2349266.1 dTDP-4-dehydrorhamnose 3,5-epimerase [Bacillus toyonensis]MED3184985.1 dTDP-4-dehydrorhamnose 3,5-epimerase [Bacillus toyonensis]
MEVIETYFTDVKLLEPQLFQDDRGFFTESYNKKTLEQIGTTHAFIQDNISYSAKAGTIRGLHFQKEPKSQTKLVHVVQGAIYDVIVDLRTESPTYRQWQGYILSADNHRQLLVPKGFAHGFCTLVSETIVMYKVDEYYSPMHDSGIHWDDEQLAIFWPVKEPILSEKDRLLPKISECEDIK